MSLYDKSLDEMLIDLVSKRPILYSSSHPQHRNYIEKHRAWEEISTILNTPIPGLKQRWKHFRDHYHKKIKQTPKQTKWKYMRLLSFLSNPKKDALSENKTEKKEMRLKLPPLTDNESSDFTNLSEFENEGSESASSTGSFSYKQIELLQPEFASLANHLDSSYTEAKNQTDHAQTIKRKQELEIIERMEKVLNIYKLPGAHTPSSSNHKSLDSPTGEMSIDTSLGINTSSNNPEIRESTTIEQTRPLLDMSLPQRFPRQPVLCHPHPVGSSDFDQVVGPPCGTGTVVPGVIGANSETIRRRLKFNEQIRNFDKKMDTLSKLLPSTNSVHPFYEAVAEIVSMFPPHLISESKLMIHKCIYRIEREYLGLMNDDEDD